MPKMLPPLGVALSNLRRDLGWSAGELAEALGMSQGQLSDYERGRKPLTFERLEEYAAPMGVSRETIREVVSQVEWVREQTGSPVYPSQPGEAGEGDRIDGVVRAIAKAAAQVSRPLVVGLDVQIHAAADRELARGAWDRLKRRPLAERRSLLRKTREYRGWAVCEAACEASLKAAPDSAARALEYAALAVEIARLPSGESELFRRRLQGYADSHLGNARRVHGDLRGADEAFGRARSLWKEGAPGDPGLLSEVRILSLEISLRIEQEGRLPEALKLLAQALAMEGNGERKTLLINHARALERHGDYGGAIASLRKAAPLINAKQEPRMLWVLQSNLIKNLCHLRRFAEAEPLLREARALADRLSQELDLLRALWIEGWVAAGLGRREEAIAALEHVTREFAERQIPFDAALAGLELAVVYLEEGRTAEVRVLAEELLVIFKAQKVHQHALAAVDLFCKAARQEAATVELARRLGDYLYRAQYRPELRFEES